MFLIGLFTMAWLLPQPRSIGTLTLDIHTLLYASLAVTLGFQSVMFWIFVKVYGMREGIVPYDPSFDALKGLLTLERGLIIGGLLLFFGLAAGIYALSSWNLAGFGLLRPSETMRVVIPSATAILLAFQIAYGAFFVSVLDIRGSRS
jgi:hypothetical protein